MYLTSKGNAVLKEIAAELGVLDTQIRKWKSTDKWDEEFNKMLDALPDDTMLSIYDCHI